MAGPRVRRTVAWLAEENLVLLALGTFGVATLLTLDVQLTQDGWLALVCGRLISRSGLPSHDTLTLMTLGKDWVDQQWLGQYFLYRVEDAGGVRLLLAFQAAIVLASVAAAAVLGRRGEATARSTASVAALALPSVAICALHVRTQTLVYPLFIAVLWLVISDARRPSSRVFWVIPLLVVWTNVHGSVVLGVGLVVLRGLWQLRSRPRRAVSLIAAASAGLAATPYVVHLPTYYHDTVLNGGFGRFVTEWQAATPGIVTAALYLLLARLIWFAGRTRMDRFELAILLLLALNALFAIRNMIWFALAAMIILPAVGARVGAENAQRQDVADHVRAGFGVVAIAAMLIAGGVVAAKPTRALVTDYPPQALAAVRNAIRDKPQARVYADERFADWLLYEIPELEGRVAYDARLELLTDSQLRAIVRFKVESQDNWRDLVAKSAVVVVPGKRPDVLQPGQQHDRALRRQPEGTRLIYRDKSVIALALPTT